MCPAHHPGQGRVCRGVGKKLIASFRDELNGKNATNQFKLELIAENEEAAAFFGDLSELKKPQYPLWAWTYIRAWQALRFDRSMGPHGSMGRIWYTSISAYAKDRKICGEDFSVFHKFVTAIDDEYLDYSAERLKEIADANP